MDTVVGGVKVEDQLLGRALMRGDQLLHQHLVDAEGVAVATVLDAAEGGERRERRPLVGVLVAGELQRRIGPQPVMIVPILVAGGQGEDAPGDQLWLLVGDVGGIPPVVNESRSSALVAASLPAGINEAGWCGLSG